ncbi:hypothetical protein BH747_04720 [Enterococcus villorum]|uniref:Uncharacterized protein n=1 Tax=Enterococcus villorum TaxID=112904 RepID=A0A1V8YDP8_9ENTE|nr:hypothetical protein [Enterococcus villorum]OQO70709.1 hypothetical protein BH747_04720 [Enterococcus villorum]OQO76541.1 hypothetical protein BH744_02780 [Enterococcus villorum]
MIPLNSKTCTKLSMIFLICCLPSITLILMSWLMWEVLPSFISFSSNSGDFIYYSWYLFSGLSLIFSTGMHAKKLKGLVSFVHFSCVYSRVVAIVPLIGGMGLLLGAIAWLLLPVMSQRKKWVSILLLGLPMAFSTACFIGVNYYLMVPSFSWEIIKYVILLSFSGIVGLILSTAFKNEKIKWSLLIINYFFATYFHVVIWIIGF